eukprot:TRINITY_DN2236_c0_g1_i2.p1 TRINITY_DN2236_c0_g1~~TRINITY_DN2236_c0_g1_i2.p1  ORF type:complete len:531 (-),score=126.19 TRINITY_DN2236_c0_g1_i2:144-1736(-)
MRRSAQRRSRATLRSSGTLRRHKATLSQVESPRRPTPSIPNDSEVDLNETISSSDSTSSIQLPSPRSPRSPPAVPPKSFEHRHRLNSKFWKKNKKHLRCQLWPQYLIPTVDIFPIDLSPPTKRTKDQRKPTITLREAVVIHVPRSRAPPPVPDGPPPLTKSISTPVIVKVRTSPPSKPLPIPRKKLRASRMSIKKSVGRISAPSDELNPLIASSEVQYNPTNTEPDHSEMRNLLVRSAPDSQSSVASESWKGGGSFLKANPARSIPLTNSDPARGNIPQKISGTRSTRDTILIGRKTIELSSSPMQSCSDPSTPVASPPSSPPASSSYQSTFARSGMPRPVPKLRIGLRDSIDDGAGPSPSDPPSSFEDRPSTNPPKQTEENILTMKKSEIRKSRSMPTINIVTSGTGAPIGQNSIRPSISGNLSMATKGDHIVIRPGNSPAPKSHDKERAKFLSTVRGQTPDKSQDNNRRLKMMVETMRNEVKKEENENEKLRKKMEELLGMYNNLVEERKALYAFDKQQTQTMKKQMG